VIGGVCAEGTVVLSQSGQIEGNVIAENIIVAGVIDGNLTIKDKTNIEPTGEVYGDISTSKILIDEQSVFQGKCNMNVDRTKSKRGGRFKVKEAVELKKENVTETVKENGAGNKKEEAAKREDNRGKDDNAEKTESQG
jgi:cytoskeletal protein CcmA (bactofilin family)